MLRDQAQKATDFSKAFRENLSKEMEQVLREGAKQSEKKQPPIK